jgi:serine/threonine-protein kinase HipA
MNQCPITYHYISDSKYSEEGLKLLSKTLTSLQDFPYTAKEQIHLAEELALKLSIQGVQPKLSIKLNIKKHIFEIVDHFGTFILKPPHHLYEEIPQNEDLSMKLASLIGINTPLTGLIYNQDQTLSYFIKRFDRGPHKTKQAVEDFSQLLGFNRDTKYDSSIEKIITVVDKFCTFPILEKRKLFKLILFNFLIGNEDMHLKNYSLITQDGVTQLSPAYDLVNTSIVLKTKEESALPLNGKKSNFKKDDFILYLAKDRLQLNSKEIESILSDFSDIISPWASLIQKSFLSKSKQQDYLFILENRKSRLFS